MESYDNMGSVGEDERWEAFGPFHNYLVQSSTIYARATGKGNS